MSPISRADVTRGWFCFLRLSTVLLLVGSCWGQSRNGDDYKATILPILDVLDRGQLSGSIEYRGKCDEYHIPDLPRVTKPSSDSGSPLQVLREMFANDEKMQVTQDPDGTIRMREADVPRDLLNVKIAHISFDDEQKKGDPMYSPRMVLNFITNAPEVQIFMKNHSIGQPSLVVNEPVAPGGPQAKGELNNVTLAEALNYMLKTFRGLLVYENCPGDTKSNRRVVFAFYPTGQRPIGQP